MKTLSARYAIFGVIAALLAYCFVPAAFHGSWLAVAGFAPIAAACVWLSNQIESKTWQTVGLEKAQDLKWRLGVRLGIYLIVPSLIIFIIGSLAPAFITLVLGWRTAFALTWLPVLFVGSYMNLLPAR